MHTHMRPNPRPLLFTPCLWPPPTCSRRLPFLLTPCLCSPSHGGASPTRSANPSRTSNGLKATRPCGARPSRLLTRLPLVLLLTPGALQATSTSRAMSRNKARMHFARWSTRTTPTQCSSCTSSVSAEYSQIASWRRPSRGARKTTGLSSSLGLQSKR